MELVGGNHKDLKNQFQITVAEGVSLPVEYVRAGHVGGVLNGDVFIAGGTNWSNDKTTKHWLKSMIVHKDRKWIEGPDLPKALAYAMYGHDATGFYLAGGTSDGSYGEKEVYWLSSLDMEGAWKSLPDLPEGVMYGAGVIFDNKFYVACGSAGNQSVNNMWCLDLNHNDRGWKECNSVPGVGRILPTLVTCGKYLYVIGGLGEGSPATPLSDLYRYCADEDKWERLPDLPLEGYAWASKQIDDDHILLTGRADGTIHDGIWIVNLKDSSVTKTGRLLSPSTTAPLIKVTDTIFWMIGGEPDSNKNRTEKISVIEVKSIKEV